MTEAAHSDRFHPDVFHLILLRHAHAEPGRAGHGDAERTLSQQGEAEADAAAKWLAANTQPRRAVCSPAARTRQTLERVLAVTGYADVRYDERIYDATPGDLVDVIEAHREGGDLLLVGHNPGLESVVALLATGQSGRHRGMPPSGVAVLALPRGSPIEPGGARLAAFWSP